MPNHRPVRLAGEASIFHSQHCFFRSHFRRNHAVFATCAQLVAPCLFLREGGLLAF